MRLPTAVAGLASLKTRIALGVCALASVVSAIVIGWTVHSVEADIRQGVIEAQADLLRHTARDVEQKVASRREAIAGAALALANVTRLDAASLDDRLLYRLSPGNLFDAVLVVGAQGQLVRSIAARSPGIGADGSVADLEIFKQLQSGAAQLMSPPFRSASGDILIVFGAATSTSQGQFKGAVLGVVRVLNTDFLGELSERPIGRGGHFNIVERDVTPLWVMHQRHDFMGQPAPGGSSHPIMAQALQGRGGWVEGVGLLGVDSLRSFTPLKSVPWVLVGAYPVAEAYAGFKQRKRELLAIGAVLFAIGAAAAWWLTGLLLRPLERFRDLMEQHAEDPVVPLVSDTFGGSELAALARAYNAQASARTELENKLKASERRMRAVMDSIPARVAHVSSDERYTYVNGYRGLTIGRDPQGMLGRTMRDVRGAAMYAKVAPYVARVLAGEAVEFETSAFDGEHRRHYQCSYVPDRNEVGQLAGFHVLAFDITSLKDAQARQLEVEQQLRAIADNIPALISYVSRDGRYGFLNATFKSWLGIDPIASVGLSMAEVIGPETYAARLPIIRRCLAGERVAFEAAAQTLEGLKNLQISYIPDVGADGVVAGFYTLTSEVTELKMAQEQLTKLARSDTLTGLPNRFQFGETLPLAIARSARSGLALALMFIDIDHFKDINDTFGHAGGDAVLTQFAARLRQSVRFTDTVARLAGDEFVVILEGLQAESQACAIATKILTELQPHFSFEGQLLRVGASMGVAFHVHATSSKEALLAQADAALYRAKAAGRNGYELVAV